MFGERQFIYYQPPINRRVARLSVFNFILGLAYGLFGQLYLPVGGFGTIAILDLVSYVIGFPILFVIWGKLGRHGKKTIVFSLCWLVAAVFSNTVNYVDGRYYLKSISVVATSVTLLSVSFFVLRRDARLYLIYALGWAVGCWIGLYHLKPGTWLFRELQQGDITVEILMDKEIYPIVAYCILYSCFFVPMYFIKKLPSFIAALGCVVSGFYLLYNGGSRSNFGILIMSALLGFVLGKSKVFVKHMEKHPLRLIVVGCAFVALVFGVYAYLASSGALGESERLKYIGQFADADTQGGIGSRISWKDTWRAVLRQPWGVGGTNQCHSVIMNSFMCEGIMGLCFWLYFYAQVFWFIRFRLQYTGRFATFILIPIMNACWACFGSPFGARNIYFSLLAFISLCRDDVEYGHGSVFVRLP